ncbi:hypothetical protein F5884DRAFT_758344 [Xylogone sp. PMI_703]|nr:hypothetical protein F5884DRAFT_758344 [Xylogone sp. PMI_703]
MPAEDPPAYQFYEPISNGTDQTRRHQNTVMVMEDTADNFADGVHALYSYQHIGYATTGSDAIQVIIPSGGTFHIGKWQYAEETKRPFRSRRDIVSDYSCNWKSTYHVYSTYGTLLQHLRYNTYEIVSEVTA